MIPPDTVPGNASGDAAFIIGSAEYGAKLFRDQCRRSPGTAGRHQRNAHPPGPKPVFYMPDFGDSRSLTQQEIANIEAYVLKLNGVDRGGLQNPGLKPADFFMAALIVFAAAVVLIAILGWRAGRGADKTG